MRKIILYTGFIIAVLLCSCEAENELLEFDTSKAYIYFNMPMIFNATEAIEERADSLEYSFAFDLESVTYTFKLPVAIVGTPAEVDRNYKIKLVEEESNASEQHWVSSVVNEPVFKKGLMFDTLLVQVNRTEDLKEEAKYLTFELLANENFDLAEKHLLKAKLIFSDILLKPVWWDDWEEIFGPFYPETFFKWKEIYYKGADPNYPGYYTIVSGDKTDSYYWDNMPMGRYACLQYYTPVLYAHLYILKEYFEENEVYGTKPDGSTSETRIQIHV